MNRSINDSTLRQVASDTQADLHVQHISEAHDKLGLLVQYCQDSQIRADFEELRNNYGAMLSFLMQGGEDKNRVHIQSDMVRQTWMLLIRAQRAVRLLSGNDHYSKTHASLLQEGGDARTLMQRWSHTLPSEERFALQDTVFDFLWTSPLWNSRDTTLWNDFILRQDAQVQQHLIWAVFLSAWEFPDLEKITLLTLMAESQQEVSRLTAVTGLVILYQQYGRDLEVLAGHNPYASLQQMLQAALVVQQEFALILASKKDLEAEEKEVQVIQQQEIDKALKQAFRIKLKYVKKRLLMGYDPNLGRLSLLHSSKFMGKCAHWFLPFDSTHPLAQSVAVEQDGTENQALARMTELSTDCDVDKYVMCELINNNKGLARTMTQQLQLAGVNEEATNPPKQPIRHAIQNLYRFFTHSAMAHDMHNPFASFELLIAQQRFRPAGSEDKCLNCVSTLIDAEEYTPAACILDSMARQYGTSTRLLRLRGQCYQHKENWQDALHCYTQAIFLEEPDVWLISHIHECYSRAGKRKEASAWLNRWMKAEPKNKKIALMQADSHMEDGNYTDALKVLYRLDYNDYSDAQVAKRIVRCKLHQSDIDTAVRHVDNMAASKDFPMWETHLLTAHIQFIRGHWASAKDFYSAAAGQFVRDGQHTYSDFLKIYEADTPLLATNGISAGDMRLMRDALWLTLIHGT